MLFRSAVICTAIGGHADYAVDQDTAMLIPTQNSQAIIQAVSQLVQDDAMRLRIAKKGHQFLLENYSWNHSVTRALDWFVSLQNE